MTRHVPRLALSLLLCVVAVALIRLASPARIVVEWETASEVGTAGFLLYRGQDPDGTFELLTETPIPSRGDPLVGAAYSYEDRDAVWGQTYFYQLEEVERGGGHSRYPEVVAARAGVGWPWALAGGALVALVWFVGSWLVLNRRPPSSD